MSKGSPPRQLLNLSHKGVGGATSVSQVRAPQLSLNLQELEPPQRVYSAELCSVICRSDEVYFVFAQRCLLGSGLESAISLRMHGFYALQFLKSIESLDPKINEISEQTNTTSHSVEEITQNPLHLAKMSANIVRSAVSGYDACCDFYQLNASNVAKALGKSEKMNLLPIARVEMRTALFLGMYEELVRLKSTFPDNLVGGAVYSRDIKNGTI